jgi:glycerophosphoryl diester phosphodiesterase
MLLGGLGGVLFLGLLAEASFRLITAFFLNLTGDHLMTLIPLLLAKGGLVATLSFVLVVGLGVITRRVHVMRNKELGIVSPDGWENLQGQEKPITPWNRRLAWLSLPLFLVAPLALWANLSHYLANRPPVQVTAHRGHARAAPENTVSAMRKAIESGADYVEMDVQLTADDKVVLLHDRDLKRVAGISRRLDEMQYEEVRQLDVGRWFDPGFAGERVPTLAEVINLCRGKIRLNIELKFFGSDRRLSQKVAELLREQEFEHECIITSMNYDALLDAKRRNPRLRTGLIIAHALGDVNQLEVDVLSVRADFLSDELIRSSHRNGRQVHVWTVNDRSQMIRLMKRGVNNIITSDPDLAVEARDEWASRTGTERLVLASRLLLGLDS